MPDSEVSPNEASQVEEAEQETAQADKEYGCIFCITGREFAVAQRLEKAIPGLKAISPVKLRYRRMDGMAHEERVILFPGYVFFEAQAGSDVEIRKIYAIQDVLRVLYSDSEDKEWRIGGPDKDLISGFFAMEGVISFSEVYFDRDEVIHAVNGFLQGKEKSILRVNKRARTVELGIKIADKSMTVWVGYKLTEENG